MELDIIVWWAPESTIANANEVPTPISIIGYPLSQIRALLPSLRPIFTAHSGIGLRVGISDTNVGPLPLMGWAMLGVSANTYGCPAPPSGGNPGNVCAAAFPWFSGDIGSCPVATGSYPVAAGNCPVAVGSYPVGTVGSCTCGTGCGAGYVGVIGSYTEGAGHYMAVPAGA